MEHSSEGLGLLWGPGKATPLSQAPWEGCNEWVLTLSSHDTDFQGLPLDLGSGPWALSVPMCWAVSTVAPGHSRILVTHLCGIPSPSEWTARVTVL